MKNLEDLYSEMLGNPSRGNITDLDRKYSEKLNELASDIDKSRVDISRIQKSGELQNAYLYLKTQWAIKHQRESGLITNQNLASYQRPRRNRYQRKSAYDKIQKFNLELRRTAKAGLILVSILFVYQIANYLINQEKVDASTDFSSTPTNGGQFTTVDLRQKQELTKVKDGALENFEALNNNLDDREPDVELIAGAKSCNIPQMKAAFWSTKNINVKNRLGETPAHWLSRLNCSGGLKWAITAGADLNLKDNSGRTAVDWAKLNNSYESIQIINQKFKKN